MGGASSLAETVAVAWCVGPLVLELGFDQVVHEDDEDDEDDGGEDDADDADGDVGASVVVAVVTLRTGTVAMMTVMALDHHLTDLLMDLFGLMGQLGKGRHIADDFGFFFSLLYLCF